MRPEPGATLLAELRPGERVERALEVCHRQATVHREPLHLVEHRGVSGVEFVGAEGPTDRHDVDRQLAFEQGTDLYGRGVRPQHLARAVRCDVERVLFASGGVVRREVQGVEVELLRLDLGPLGQLPTHRDERVRDVFRQDRDGMARTDRLAGRRQRHVDLLGLQRRSVPLGAQHLESLVVGALSVRPGHVHEPTRVGAGLLGQRRQRLAGQGDGRSVAEVRGLGSGERVEVGGLVEGALRRIDRCGQRFLSWSGLIRHPAIISDCLIALREHFTAVPGPEQVTLDIPATRGLGAWRRIHHRER